MDRSVALRSALVQLSLVAVVSIVLALALPHSFFEDWGWVSGPLAWVLCALGTARILGLPTGSTLVGAVLAGLPSVLAVVIGIHWLGALLAVILFALWCGFQAASRGSDPTPGEPVTA